MKTNVKKVLAVVLLLMMVAAVGYAREKTSLTGWVVDISIEEGWVVVNVDNEKDKPSGTLERFSDPDEKLKGRIRMGKKDHVFIKFEASGGDKAIEKFRILPGGC